MLVGFSGYCCITLYLRVFLRSHFDQGMWDEILAATSAGFRQLSILLRKGSNSDLLRMMLESGAGLAAHGRGETLLHAMPERLIRRGSLAFALKRNFAWVEVRGIRRVRNFCQLFLQHPRFFCMVSVQVIEMPREIRQPSRFSRPSEAVSRRNLCAPWHRPWMLMALRPCIPSCWTSSKPSKFCGRIGRTKKLRWRACRSSVAHLQTQWSHKEMDDTNMLCKKLITASILFIFELNVCLMLRSTTRLYSPVLHGFAIYCIGNRWLLQRNTDGTHSVPAKLPLDSAFSPQRQAGMLDDVCW